jgi:hypothetical protein
VDLSEGPEEQAFRAEVQAFMRDRLPPELAHKVRTGMNLTKADQEGWHRVLNEKSWFASMWPVERGGAGWGFTEQAIFEYEAEMANAPTVVTFGVAMLARFSSNSVPTLSATADFPGFSIAATGGARVIPSRARDRIWPACARPPCVTAIITSSTGRKYGRHSASTRV